MVRKLLPFPTLLFLALVGCEDESPTSSDTTSTTTTTAPATGGSAFLRAAQLSHDGRTIDLVVNGRVAVQRVAYRSVSSYVELDAGEYRVQFFPSGDRDQALIETMLTLQGNQSVTVALGGLRSFEVYLMEDDSSTSADRTRVKFLNAVPDFPVPFDLAVRNGPLLFQDAAYFQPTAYQELIPGIYDLALRRGGTSEDVVVSPDHAFSPGTSYTLFAVGSLRRNDIEIIAASDSR